MHHIWDNGNNAFDLMQSVFSPNIFGEKYRWKTNRRGGKDGYPETVITNIERRIVLKEA